MNQHLKKYAALLNKKKRQEEKKFMIEGVRLCQEALRSDWNIEMTLISDGFSQSEHWLNFKETLDYKKIPYQMIQNKYFERLSDTDTPQGILMIMAMPSYNLERLNLRKASLMVLLQGIRDPGNLGTILRTADWYGANAVILSEDCVDPFNPKVLRSSMGSIFHLPVYTARNFAHEIQMLKKHHFWIIASAIKGDKVLHKSHFKKPIALILGGEAQGVSPVLQQHADMTVRIWKYGKAESLNVAIASGVLMNHISSQIFTTEKNESRHGRQ